LDFPSTYQHAYLTNRHTTTLDTRYTFFWDKMERANYFIETMSELADEPLDGRLIQHLLTAPLEDGGQWDMFANLVEKYCPAVLPPTASIWWLHC
jgi:bleomycin hydrolase